MCNYIHYKVCGEYTYPLQSFNGTAIKSWEWISNFIAHMTRHEIVYPGLD